MYDDRIESAQLVSCFFALAMDSSHCRRPSGDGHTLYEWASSSSNRSSSSDVIKNLLEVANSRPGTNVAKAIAAYQDFPGLSTLLLLLEEVSKNTDFSTDMRLSLSYYMDEFLRQVSGASVPRRSVIAAAGSVLQYCSKIYGDRVELMYQVVEHQIEALLIADPKKDENSNRKRDASKPEEPRKRRIKKLTQKEFDPFSYKMEPKKFKIMSDEKRFSRVGFETNINRNRTIEHMYQDHTPSHLWKHASIVDPANPYEQDEKKNYKVFTYHPEPRYNTLLPDIQFDRLNLIKEYVHSNQVDVSDTLNKNMTNKEYLDEYIALENQMLASRYGEKTGLKRTLTVQEDEQAKRLRLELQKRLLEFTDESSKRRRLTEEMDDNRDGNLETDESGAKRSQTSMDSVLRESLKTLTLTDTSQVQLNENKIEALSLSSTLHMNDASCLDSTRLDLQQLESIKEETKQESQQKSQLELCTGKGDDSNEQSLQIDSGIGMDDVCDTLPTGQSFDDEGVVLTDLIDDQRLQSLSPKVMVRDILPGVPDKANLSVRVDAEMLALSGINETLEEIVDVPREVHYSIERNLLQLPEKRLRKGSLFKLPKEFDLFKKARTPAKRQAEPKAPGAPRALPTVSPVASPTHSVSSLDKFPALPLDQMEFDSELNFRGFRRPTYDSGIDQEEIRLANSPADDGIIVDVGSEEPSDSNALENSALSNVIQEARDSEQTEKDLTLPEISLGATESNETQQNGLQHTQADEIRAQDITEEDIRIPDTTAENTTLLESGLNAMPMDLATNDIELDSDWDAEESDSSVQENCNSIDAETDAKIIDWHRRLAPTLEAAHARQNFSIQHLNDEIIAKCQENDGEATLADVIEDKDPTKLCCYMLSSLLLTNQRNVELQIDKHDKSKPIEMNQFKMKLISTERKQVNPEDDIGNMDISNQRNNQAASHETPQSANAAHRKVQEQRPTLDAINPIILRRGLPFSQAYIKIKRLCWPRN
ncbi:uncharacterized protein Dvir_GJ24014, isoform E [Drosophila virilis]|uniref:Uncharacterized protein, isoform E n=2 Tax=Drosophila virilis TaxID=7244 RepID=A0A0Q9WGF7_DROVI|nr:uncharacterized protein Dvir_GJ24014, isoform E [Drosophila virilis]